MPIYLLFFRISPAYVTMKYHQTFKYLLNLINQAKMKKTSVIFGIFIAAILALAVFAFASPGTNQAAAANGKSGREVNIPENAVEVAPGVFSLGTREHNGEIVEGIAIVDYKKGYSHKPGHVSGAASTTTKCYAFFARGAKWKNIEPYLVNPSNTRGLNSNFVFDNVASDIAKWESASGVNIFGAGNLTSATLTADRASPDNLNEVYFADVASPGAIAVTIVWGIFSGPVSNRKLVEWDQVYDDIDFDWSSSGEAGKMDFENIATHELGHSTGMGHPSDSCTEETMFRFADYGETKKRDLNSGDIAGIQDLY